MLHAVCLDRELEPNMLLLQLQREATVQQTPDVGSLEGISYLFGDDNNVYVSR